LAICWEELYIFTFIISLSAGNLISLNLLRIFRDYTPKLFYYENKKYLNTSRGTSKKHQNTYKNYKFNKNFASYITGLIEGDGSIIVPKTERSPKGKLYYPSIQIVFDLRDLPLGLIIQQKLSHGSISRKKGVNAYVLTINNYEGIILVVNIINGYMRTPKINALYKLIDFLNIKFDLSIEKKIKDKSNIKDNSWLAGFIDADGHFSVRTTTVSKYPKMECKFEVSQRQNDHNNENNYEYLSLIADLLSTTVKEVRGDKPNPEYRVRTTSLNGGSEGSALNISRLFIKLSVIFK